MLVDVATVRRPHRPRRPGAVPLGPLRGTRRVRVPHLTRGTLSRPPPDRPRDTRRAAEPSPRPRASQLTTSNCPTPGPGLTPFDSRRPQPTRPGTPSSRRCSRSRASGPPTGRSATTSRSRCSRTPPGRSARPTTSRPGPAPLGPRATQSAGCRRLSSSTPAREPPMSPPTSGRRPPTGPSSRTSPARSGTSTAPCFEPHPED